MRWRSKTHISSAPSRRSSSTRTLLDGLERAGFKLDFGEDGTGWQFKYLTRGGGYYFNVGCSDLIVEGEIGLVQFADIDRFVAEGARMRNGETLPPTWSCWRPATRARSTWSSKLFGDEVAARVGPIWGFGDGQELRNMFTRTPQPGPWFIAGSFAQCRIYSKYLALQIKATRGRPHRSLARRSSGGAISVTRSVISTLFGSGSSVVSFSVNRVVQA